MEVMVSVHGEDPLVSACLPPTPLPHIAPVHGHAPLVRTCPSSPQVASLVRVNCLIDPPTKA